MKINSNEGTLGGSVIQINDNGNDQSILWVQHTPIAEGQYQPKPVLLRLIINTPLVQDLAIVNGTAIIAKVEINSFQTKGNNASKLTITEYVVIDVLSVSNGGESIANEFLLGGTVGKVEKNPNNAFQADAGVTVLKGALEGSNVNAVGEMTNLIDLQRQFEMQVKMMSTAEEMDKASDSLLRMG
jgi:flagellar basal body rod protein FlgC